MKRIGIWILGILVVIGLLTIVWSRFFTPKIPTSKTQSSETQQNANVTKALQAGKDITCYFKDQVDGVNRGGTLYISNNNFSSDYKLDVGNGKINEVHMLGDGQWFYIWSADSQPFKINISQGEQSTATKSAEELINSYIKLGQNADISCIAWVVDKTKFEIPTDVQFMDITQKLIQYKLVPSSIPTK